MSNKGKEESFSIDIIGGVDGPTVMYVMESEGKTSAERQWQRVLDACKKQAVTKERNFTGEEIKTYIIETYGAKEIESTTRQRLMLKLNVLFNFYPEALQRSTIPDKNADKEEWLKWAQQDHMNYLNVARQISDETYGLRYVFLQIPRTEITEVYYLAREEEHKKYRNKWRDFYATHGKSQYISPNEEEVEIQLEIELSTGYMMMKNGCTMLMNEIILWRGITKEEIEKCTPSFMAFAAAMRDTGKLDLR